MAGTNTPKSIPVGTRFGRLVVKGVGVPYLPPSGKRASTSNCLCDCGVLKENIRNRHLKKGETKSCGCWQYSKEVVERRIANGARKHGESRSRDGRHSRAYSAWVNMLARTRGHTHAAHIYKGMEVESAWDPRQGGSFENFKKDMGDRPKGMTLERKDGKKGYVRGNCVWADRVAQNRNTTRTYTQEYVEEMLDLWESKKGSMTQNQFCEEIGVSRAGFLYWRKQRCPERGLVGSKWHPKAQERSQALKEQPELMTSGVRQEALTAERLSGREARNLREMLGVAIARSPRAFRSARGWQESGFEKYSVAQVRRHLEILVRDGRATANRSPGVVRYGAVDARSHHPPQPLPQNQ